ncbi:MAG: glycosyltransferase [Gemmatimonadaceae bacterium]
MQAQEAGEASLDLEFSVVSGSNPAMLFGCLASLHETMRESSYTWRVTVICNGAGGGLAARVRDAYPDARVFENDRVKGFAENHNVVLRVSEARYVWILNDDLIILPGSIERVTQFLDAPGNARVAVASPRLLNPDGTLQPSTYGFPSMPQILLAHSGLRERSVTEAALRRLAPLLRPRAGESRFWAHDRTVEVETLRGACVAVRAEAVRTVGLMTEVARVGAEETEWHRRFARAGWKVTFIADAAVIHYGSQTVGKEGAANYPEYLKGALHFFRSDRAAPVYRLYCIALLGLFTVRAAFNLVTLDRNGFRLARRYFGVAWKGLFVGDENVPAGARDQV